MRIEDNYILSFDMAVKPISKHLKELLLCVDNKTKEHCNEIRLRKNKPVVLMIKNKCAILRNDGSVCFENKNPYICSEDELNDTFIRMCDYSVHTHTSDITDGYITIDGGHRVGVVGTASRDRNDNIVSIRDISFLNIRIARSIKNCSEEIYSRLFTDKPLSIIIAGPPTSGKTTILRDLVHKISDSGVKVSVIDERNEIALKSIKSIAEIGINTDVYSGYPKTSAINIALRTMSPQLIAIDEVCEDGEIYAIKKASNCGVKIIVTVHASSYSELLTRYQIKSLIDTYSFDKLVLLTGADKPGKISGIYDIQELRDEMFRSSVSMDLFCDDWNCNIRKT